MFNQTLAEPIVDVETGEIAAEEGTVLDRRNLDKIIDVLESNANIHVYELNSGVLDEPVEVQTVKIYIPGDEENVRQQ